jgi:hypothetical protein
MAGIHWSPRCSHTAATGRAFPRVDGGPERGALASDATTTCGPFVAGLGAGAVSVPGEEGEGGGKRKLLYTESFRPPLRRDFKGPLRAGAERFPRKRRKTFRLTARPAGCAAAQGGAGA